MFKPIFALAIVIVAVIGTQSAFAVASTGYSLVLTENSSTSLTLTYNGPAGVGAFSVNPTGSDTWSISVTQMFGSPSFMNFSNDWVEPEDPTQAFINEVFYSGDFPNTIFVRSDLNILLDQLGTVSPNDTPYAIAVGTDSGLPIFLTFNDLAQSAEAAPSQGVPDSGSTLGLLALASLGLLGVSQVRFAQAA